MQRIFLVIVVVVLLSPFVAHATPEHAERTGQACSTCHLSPMGGSLSETGLRFAASGYRWPPSGGFRVLGPLRKGVRLVVGFVHIVAAFFWFGTILYVHILLRPAYASKGLPRGEMMLGLISMGLVGATGVLLTLSKVAGLDVFISSAWGRWLAAKILLYFVMTGSAVFVVSVLGPKLRRGGVRAEIPASGIFDPLTLSAFDGAGGRPAYIAYKDKVYDMAGLRLWKDGKHMKHGAGTDLTAALPKAPHGEEKLADLPVVGSYDAARQAPLTGPQRTFYVMAYLNLALVFAVLFVIACWRWGV